LVDERWVLQSVSPRQVEIGPQGAAAQLTLDLPRLPPPATGVPGQASPSPSPAAGVVRVVPVPATLAADNAPPVPPVQMPAGVAPTVPPGVMPGQPQEVQGGPAPVDPGAVR